MSRLIYSLSADEVFPKWRWLGKLDKNGSPRNAILFVVGVSLVIPFFGRTVVGWPVDVSSIGAAVAYCVTSAAAFKFACRKGDGVTKVTGLVGAVMSIVFCLLLLVPNYLAGSVLSAESYLVLALWCIIGFALYRSVFKSDRFQRFGRSPVVWTGIVIMIIFSSLMWARLSALDVTGRTVNAIVAFQERHCALHHGASNVDVLHHEQGFITGEMEKLNDEQLGHDIVQMALLAFSLIIIFNLYAIQRRRQEALEVAQAKVEARDRAKSAFLSSVSHDIRTPMNAIVGYIELARRAGDNLGLVHEYVGKLEASSHHLMALINDVLEMSRIESGREELEPAPMDLVTVFREVGDVFSAQMSEKGIRFSIDTTGLVHRHVMCDRNRFNRVLLNLISNAWKFTQSGGSISVTMREEGSGNGTNDNCHNCSQITNTNSNSQLTTHNSQLSARLNPDNPANPVAVYELRVKDTGLGMSRGFVKRVFDPFERERTSAMKGVEGTGLGMPITKGIVTLMGGTIDVESEQGKGTEFIVRLPLALVEEEGMKGIEGTKGMGGETEDPCPAASENPLNPVDPSNPSRHVPSSAHRLLLVEDNEINREIAYTLLTQSGFSVDQAEDGKVAVEKFVRGGPGFYDAILMDVHMPVMNGYSAAKTIRALEAPGEVRVPIIAVSANAFESDVRAALASGMDAHIAKPIKIAALLKTLDGLVRDATENVTNDKCYNCSQMANEDALSRSKADPLAALAQMGCAVETTLRDTYADDRAFYLKMLGKLPGNTALAKMREALDAGNPAELFSASHNLKGVYASLGLTPLHALCGEIVEISRSGGLDGAAERLSCLEGLHRDVLDVARMAGG